MIPGSFEIRDRRKIASHNVEPDLTKVAPLGRYGGGEWTAHPIGLVIVLGFLLMGLVGIPQFKWFFAATFVLGSVFGLFLWLGHR
jgi:hypothetical protein